MTAGASAFYVFLNALIYLVTKLQLGGLAGTVLYIGYSALISFLFFILTGMCSVSTVHVSSLIHNRQHRLLRQLGIRVQDLRFYQDRLNDLEVNARSKGETGKCSRDFEVNSTETQ